VGLGGGTFAIAYAAFEIPSVAIGDCIGPRKILNRIVLWWSLFMGQEAEAGSAPPEFRLRLKNSAIEHIYPPNPSDAVRYRE